MNLQKLFETQKVLRDRINYQGEDRFEKLILALLVELGELCQEWRGFKFWSKNQEPRTRKLDIRKMQKVNRGEIQVQEVKELFTNPLLEEYVDCLHFLLEIGLEEFEAYGFKYPVNYSFNDYTPIKEDSVTIQFNSLFTEVGILNDVLFDKCYEVNSVEDSYENAFRIFIGLGEMLGFTWEEIESAYFEKNKINHVRQDTGY
ncbi:MAG: dUTP diphosphatase [Niallia sp.]